MKQLIIIHYDYKLESETTPPDDIEGSLFNFIPPDYSKSSFAFDETIHNDSTSFVPLGEKVGSYARPTAAHLASLNAAKGKNKGKGKGKANGQSVKAEIVQLEEDSPDAVVYEMYRVSGEDKALDLVGDRVQMMDTILLLWLTKQATWGTPGFREYHRRMQLFILLFIEGGSYVHVRGVLFLPEALLKLYCRKTRKHGSLSYSTNVENDLAQTFPPIIS